MKKYFIVLLAFFASCTNEIIISRATFNLKGNVKSISDTQGQGTYDENWNVYPDDTSIMVSFINTQNFDKDGKWISAKMELTNGILYFKTEVIYDDNGNYAGTKDFDEKDNLMRETNVTEISRDRICMTTKDSEGRAVSESISEYRNGLLEKQTTTYLPEGNFKTTHHYKRDKDGNETEITINTIDVNSVPVETEKTMKVKILKDDDYGNWTRQVYYNLNNNTCIILDRKIVYYE